MDLQTGTMRAGEMITDCADLVMTSVGCNTEARFQLVAYFASCCVILNDEDCPDHDDHHCPHYAVPAVASAASDVADTIPA